MSAPTIKVDLTRRLVDGSLGRHLEQLPIRWPDHADEVLTDIADLMVGYAKVFVRVDTGSLRDSIRKERPRGPPPKRTIRVRAGGYKVNPKTKRLVDYAVIVEHKYPYMHPAWLQVKPTMEQMIRSHFLEMLSE